MSFLPASSCLAEFAPPVERPRAGFFPARVDGPLAAERAQELQAAFERGVAEGRAAAEAGIEDILSREHAAYTASLAEARRSWVEDESARIAHSLADGLAALEQRLADQVAQILLPFVEEQVRVKAVGELMQALAALPGADGEGVEIAGTAPRDLIAALTNRETSPLTAGARLTEGGPEISLGISETRVETRIAAWIGELRAAVS